jgi:hypothetical protein
MVAFAIGWSPVLTRVTVTCTAGTLQPPSFGWGLSLWFKPWFWTRLCGADDCEVVRRLLVWLSAVPLAFVLGVSLYAGLVKAGLARNPFAPVTTGELALAQSDKPGLRVLFVGNSFTFRNDLPQMVGRLSGGPSRIIPVSYTAGGWRLRYFAEDRELERLLRDVHWDVVVLQEQSQIPSFGPDFRAREFDPYVRTLAQKIEAAGARPLLFLTWGYRTGDRRNFPSDTYLLMQDRLAWGYGDAARLVGAQVAPVGTAWLAALSDRPQLDLWAGDGKHPSRLGSYLAACVFSAMLTKRSPVGNHFTAGLSESDARFLQHVAWEMTRAAATTSAGRPAASTPFRPPPGRGTAARAS